MRVRMNVDGVLVSPGMNAGGDFGELTVTAAFTLTTPTTAADIKASTVTAGNVSGCTLSASAGSVTIRRTGLYLVYFNIADCTGVDLAVWTFDVYKNAAVLAPVIRSTLSQIATKAVLRPAFAASGVLSLVKNDVITYRGTADTGSIVFANGRFGVVQLADLPAPTVTGE